MNLRSNKQLAKEINSLLLSLDPVLNQHCKELLEEVEGRLRGCVCALPSVAVKQKPPAKKSPTKDQIFLKYYNK